MTWADVRKGKWSIFNLKIYQSYLSLKSWTEKHAKWIE